MISISQNILQTFSSVVKSIEISPSDFCDERFFPSKKAELELVANYFFFMTAIDHRTGTPDRDFRAKVSGETLRGSDLLYYLAARKFEEDPEFFTPKRILKAEPKEIASFMTFKDITPLGLEIRVFLLKDAALKLERLYSGSVLELIKASRGFLYNVPEGGLIERLKVFRAYEDPVEKKPFLLVKFLMRRGLFQPKDPENLQIPVDNHVTRIAVRTGLIEPSTDLLDLFTWSREASYEDDVIIRMVVRTAFKRISETSGKDIMLLDDFLWFLGRTRCFYKAECGNCPLASFCLGARNQKRRVLKEHYYFKTWYY